MATDDPTSTLELAPTAAVPITELKHVVDPSELPVSYYHELGLGRAVNVTDQKMWKNKTSFLVKTAHSPDDIDVTQECGLLERYKTEVATFSSQSQSVQVSLENPSSNVKIGMDEYYSRSSSSKQTIVGQKIEKCTISFKFSFDDVPHAHRRASLKHGFSVPDNFIDNNFEEGLASWLLKQIGRNEEENGSNDPLQDSEPAIKKLAKKLTSRHNGARFVRKICPAFVNYLGVTHYVSAIKLGACQYRVVTSRSEAKTLGLGATMTSGSNALAKGKISHVSREQLTEMADKEQKIGRIDQEKEEVTSPAVIEFEIQPLYKLVRIEFLQMALRQAIKEYIEHRMTNTKGPYLISSEVNRKTIFLKVNEGDNFQLAAADDSDDASLFYIISTEDSCHPSEFLIAYFEEPTEEVTSSRKLQPAPRLPLYLSTDTNVFGKCNEPLCFKSTVEKKHARFSLHSRVQSSLSLMMCTSAPVRVDSWITGEQLYIMCTHRSLKMNGYIAIESGIDSGIETENTTADEEPVHHVSYRVTTVALASGKDPAQFGMLFRLRPLAGPSLSDLKAASEKHMTN